MKSNKNIGIIFLILFVVFNVVAFAIPSNFTITFWIAYIFTVIAFGSGLYTWVNYFKKNKSLKSKFLNISTITISFYYIIIQVAAFVIFKFAYMLPSWTSILVCVIILAFALISLIGVDSSAEYIASIDEKVSAKVQSVKIKQMDVELVASNVKDKDVKEKVLELAEIIRFSDPMSNEQLAGIEKIIAEKIDELKSIPEADMMSLIEEIEKLIDERNKKCKILK